MAACGSTLEEIAAATGISIEDLTEGDLGEVDDKVLDKTLNVTEAIDTMIEMFNGGATTQPLALAAIAAIAASLLM